MTAIELLKDPTSHWWKRSDLKYLHSQIAKDFEAIFKALHVENCESAIEKIGQLFEVATEVAAHSECHCTEAEDGDCAYCVACEVTRPAEFTTDLGRKGDK